MSRIVLDTNVLVSAVLSPRGASHRVLLLVLRGEIQLAIDHRIQEEYREVLARGKFRFDLKLINELLMALFQEAQEVIPAPVAGSFPDEDDRVFVEVALASQAQALVTGNTRHYHAARDLGLRVMTPVEFLSWWASKR